MSNLNTKTKIIFFGSFNFAVPTLEKLVTIPDYEIVAVVTNPDKLAGRKKVPAVSPIKSKSIELGLNIYQPEKLRNNEELSGKLNALNADLGIVVGYSKVLPPEILTIPRLGMLNIHPSLLPKYRGPSPVAAAILNGETQTGVTVMQMDSEVDHGPVVAQKTLDMKPEDTAVEVYRRLFYLGTELLIEVLPVYLSGHFKPAIQDDSQATFSKMIRTEDGEIKQTDTVTSAINKVRALNPEPGTFVVIDGKRLKVLEAARASDDTRSHLKLSDGLLELRKVQPEGGNPMSGEDWQRGRRSKTLS